MKLVTIFAFLFLAISSQAFGKEPLITLKTAKGDFVQIERTEILDALEKQYTGAHYEERYVNSDGSVTFTNPRVMYEGGLVRLYGENIPEKEGKRETEKGYCKRIENLGYQSRSHLHKMASSTVVLEEDGKFSVFFPLQMSGIITSVTCK